MFLAECKDSTGAPIPMTFGHTARVAKDLLAAEAATKAAQDGGEEASNTAINTKPKRRSKAAETTEKIVGLSVPKVSLRTLLIACTDNIRLRMISLLRAKVWRPLLPSVVRHLPRTPMAINPQSPILEELL